MFSSEVNSALWDLMAEITYRMNQMVAIVRCRMSRRGAPFLERSKTRQRPNIARA